MPYRGSLKFVSRKLAHPPTIPCSPESHCNVSPKDLHGSGRCRSSHLKSPSRVQADAAVYRCERSCTVLESSRCPCPAVKVRVVHTSSQDSACHPMGIASPINGHVLVPLAVPLDSPVHQGKSDSATADTTGPPRHPFVARPTWPVYTRTTPDENPTDTSRLVSGTFPRTRTAPLTIPHGCSHGPPTRDTVYTLHLVHRHFVSL